MAQIRLSNALPPGKLSGLYSLLGSAHLAYLFLRQRSSPGRFGAYRADLILIKLPVELFVVQITVGWVVIAAPQNRIPRALDYESADPLSGCGR